MSWVPPDKRDSTWYIFNQKFLCSVPYIDTRSSYHVREFGTPTSGVKEIDRALMNDRIQTYLSISQMADYFKKGTVVGVIKVGDTELIYRRITEHLEAWHRQLRGGLNNGNAPLDDLLLLDKLASAVYSHAKKFFTPDLVDSLLVKNISSMVPFSKESLMRTLITANQKPEDKPRTNEERKEAEDPYPKRESMADFLIDFKTGTNISKKRSW